MTMTKTTVKQQTSGGERKVSRSAATGRFVKNSPARGRGTGSRPAPRTDEAAQTAAAEAWLDSLDPAETPADDPRDLRRVGLAQRALEDAERDLHAAVSEAREAGKTWSEIGRSLGVTRQAAQMRFGKAVAHR